LGEEGNVELEVKKQANLVKKEIGYPNYKAFDGHDVRYISDKTGVNPEEVCKILHILVPAGLNVDEEITMPDNPDYSGYDKPTFQRKGIVPGQPTKPLPGMNDKKKPGWVGVDTTKPAYQRQADYDQEREQMKKLAGVK
jgi:hypothetical protein